jgi:preprotein translocase subunit SecB
MTTVEQATFQFKGFEILESHIVRKEIEEPSLSFSLSFDPRGVVDKEKRTFKIYLGVHINANEGYFVADFQVLGGFSYSENTVVENLNNLFFTNAPAILFPYVRAYISTITNLSGTLGITLPTLNLSSLGPTLKDNTQGL